MKLFERQIGSDLLRWKTVPNRKPLIIRGARQVGKTTLVKKFSETYRYSIILNLEKESDKYFFEAFNNVSDIIEAIFLKNNISSANRGETLLFIDEIQESSRAIEFLRYFYEEIPELHVIAAGSLIEFTLKEVKSFPVGRVEYLYLHPLNFAEFLKAGEQENVLEQLNTIPVQKFAHNHLLELFNRYTIVGGMPEIVANYYEHERISDLTRIYESLWGTYKDDILKYARNTTEQNVMKHIINSAYLHIDQRVKFQNFGNSNYKSREVGESFRNLEGAKLIRLIYPSTALDLPIQADIKKSPRLQFLDTGIINYLSASQTEMLAMKDLSPFYKGSLIPHIVTQELISLNSTSDSKPNFWVREKSQSSSEVDLILPFGNKVIPIEIKSGSTGKLKSLFQFMQRSEHKYAVRMYGGEFTIHSVKSPEGKEFLLMNLPYYLTTKIFDYLDYFISAF